jgi:hypothetical protein
MHCRERSTGAAGSWFVPVCAAFGAVMLVSSCLNPVPEEFPSRRDLQGSGTAEPPAVVAPEDPGVGLGPSNDGENFDPAPDAVGSIADAGAPEPDGSAGTSSRSGDAGDEGDP